MPALAFQHGQERRKLRRTFAGAMRSNAMMDILMLALGFGLFALAIGYTYACERL